MVENEETVLIKSVGEKIRQRRTELNLSQESLSFTRIFLEIKLEE
jgi:hypothetical protein